jgi:copper chaperone CopZ
MSKQSVYFDVEDMHTRSSKKSIMNGLNELKGIIGVSINFDTKSVAVDFDNTGPSVDQIEKKIVDLGYHPILTNNETHVM